MGACVGAACCKAVLEKHGQSGVAVWGNDVGVGARTALACCMNLHGWLEATESWCMGKELFGIAGG